MAASTSSWSTRRFWRLVAAAMTSAPGSRAPSYRVGSGGTRAHLGEVHRQRCGAVRLIQSAVRQLSPTLCTGGKAAPDAYLWHMFEFCEGGDTGIGWSGRGGYHRGVVGGSARDH